VGAVEHRRHLVPLALPRPRLKTDTRFPADALLFDLGGVVMSLDWDRAFSHWAGDSGESAAALRRRFRFDIPYERHERGEIGERDYYASLRESLGIELTDAQWDTGWGAIFTGEIAPTVDAIAKVKARVPVYAFSNSNAAHQRVWSRRFAGALGHFRKVFVSSELGKRKPERAAFEAIAREIGVPVDRILFFDDTMDNVEGARAAGLHAVHVRTPQDVRDALRPWLEAT
jgi:HAD superfamily hydrolase (TIGR01549 family)